MTPPTVTIQLTVDQAIDLIWTVRNGHQNACTTDNCDCRRLEETLAAALPNDVDPYTNPDAT